MIKYHDDIIQGSDEWYAVRCGLLTASEMDRIVTPKKLDIVDDPMHLYELLAQRVSNYVEPSYIGDDMLRGHEDEEYGRELYAKHYSPVQTCGFITNDKWGFTLGYSPDWLVGGDGLGECKSRIQKHQMKTILSGAMPDDYRIQVQTGLIVSERKWVDFMSYCGGLPTKPIRVFSDEKIQTAILRAADAFEKKLSELLSKYHTRILDMIPTERKIEQEMHE